MVEASEAFQDLAIFTGKRFLVLVHDPVFGFGQVVLDALGQQADGARLPVVVHLHNRFGEEEDIS